jgi:hypothetical protein
LRRVITEDGLRFFELRVPIASRATLLDSQLTTSSIFSPALDQKTARPRLIPESFLSKRPADYYDFLDLILRNELSQSEVARLTSRSRNYNQFLRLLIAIEKAEALTTRVLID